MGYTVLYIAFGVVALWLLGEVLLQYKARLRWRLLAFAGFLAVATGVLLPSVVVIALGAVAFGAGQTFVTLSYRRGFQAGWALPVAYRIRYGGDIEDAADDAAADSAAAGDGGGRRAAAPAHPDGGPGPEPGPEPGAEPWREPAAASPAEQTMVAVGSLSYGEDADEVTPFGVAYDYGQASATVGAGATQAFQPMRMPDDGDQFGTYQSGSAGGQDPYGGGGYQEYGGPGGGQGYADQQGYGDQGYGGQGQGGYDGWGGGQQQPAAYDASYGWDGQGGPDQGYGGYADPYGGQGQDYGQAAQPGQYQAPYGYETPPGGVWTPGDQQPPQQQPYVPQQSQQPPYEQGSYGTDPYDPYHHQG